MRIDPSDAPRCTPCQAPVAPDARWCGHCGARRSGPGGVVPADTDRGPAVPRVGAAIVAAIVLVTLVVTGLGRGEPGFDRPGAGEPGTDIVDPSVANGDVGTGIGGPRSDADDARSESVRRADTFPLSPTTDTFPLSPTTDNDARPVCVSSGECLVWTVEQPGRGPVWRDVSVDGELLVLTDRLGTTALGVEDGATRWRIEADPTTETGARGHAISDSLVVLVERDGVLRGYDRSTGRLRWISPLPAALRVRHAVDHGELVVVVADAVAGAAGAVRLLAGFDRVTGERRWLRRASSAGSTSDGPVVFDGPRNLRGLDPATGLMRWQAEVDGPVGSVIGVGRSAVYVGWDQTVVASALRGPIATTTGPPPRLVAVDHAESLVLLGDDRIELVTGTGSRWTVSPPAGPCCAAATVLGGDVVVVDDEGGRTVFDGTDGTLVEQVDGRGDGVFVGTAWLAAASGDRLPGRQAASDPDRVAVRVFDARGGRVVATTPPGLAVAGTEDGVVIAGAGWLSRIRTD